MKKNKIQKVDEDNLNVNTPVAVKKGYIREKLLQGWSAERIVELFHDVTEQEMRRVKDYIKDVLDEMSKKEALDLETFRAHQMQRLEYLLSCAYEYREFHVSLNVLNAISKLHGLNKQTGLELPSVQLNVKWVKENDEE